nr:hypothetical protein GCM10020093_011510 [Planobispora longispora]
MTAAAVLRTDQSYTVSAWAKLSRGDVSSAVVSQDGAVNSAFKLAYSSGDKKWRLAAYAADATGSGESKAVSSQEAKIGVWTHLTGIYDAQARKLRLYEDGELVAESDYTSNWNATGGLLIGRTKFDGAYQHSFRGTLDEVRAYDKVLSADQVRTLTATTTPKVSADGRVGSWKMEEGTGTELADGSGHGRGATLTGSIAWSEGKIGRGSPSMPVRMR